MRLRCDARTIEAKHVVYEVIALWDAPAEAQGAPQERRLMAIGCCPIADVFTLKDARRLPYWTEDFATTDACEIAILSVCDTAEEAEATGRATHAVMRPEHPFVMPTIDQTNRAAPRAVRCIETGQNFPTLSAAARHFNCDLSALSRHISGTKGYRTVAGHTFERINA